MALVIGDNFSFQGAKPLDGRLKYDTLANMKSVGDSTMYDGCLAYCVATDKTYQWKSTNTVDTDTGKWREFTTGSALTAGDGIDITNDVISTDNLQSGDMDDIVTPKPACSYPSGGGNPTGTIISFFGESAPDGYLICDGTIYNKSDYSKLSTHLLALTDHSAYEVDGDNTKFKVPDLRGEFLRGTGTNSHGGLSGDGANVGVHQNPTTAMFIIENTYENDTLSIWLTGTYKYLTGVFDKSVNGNIRKKITPEAHTPDENISYGSVRPTNTSVLYCIKY